MRVHAGCLVAFRVEARVPAVPGRLYWAARRRLVLNWRLFRPRTHNAIEGDIHGDWLGQVSQVRFTFRKRLCLEPAEACSSVAKLEILSSFIGRVIFNFSADIDEVAGGSSISSSSEFSDASGFRGSSASKSARNSSSISGGISVDIRVWSSSPAACSAAVRVKLAYRAAQAPRSFRWTTTRVRLHALRSRCQPSPTVLRTPTAHRT